MNYGNLFKTGAILVAAATLTCTACKKSSNNNNTTTTAKPSNADDNGGYASDAARMETNSNDVISIADAAQSTGAANLRTTSGGYPTVTFSASGTDTTMTINFGSSPHLCADYKYRSGEILVSYTGPYKATGTVRNITYSDYVVDSNQIMGNKTVVNEGSHDSGEVYYNVTVNDSMMLNGSDSIITWTGSRVRTWLAGYSTPERSDDVYSIANGSAAAMILTRANGHVFTFNITAPLVIALSCPFIEAGTVNISSSSFSAGARVLDYGSTTDPVCDALATLTIGSTTYYITLYR